MRLRKGDIVYRFQHEDDAVVPWTISRYGAVRSELRRPHRWRPGQSEIVVFQALHDEHLPEDFATTPANAVEAFIGRMKREEEHLRGRVEWAQRLRSKAAAFAKAAGDRMLRAGGVSP